MDIDLLEGLKVLYVEEDIKTQKDYVKLFSKYIKKLILAEDGQEGLELYKKHNPDIIITGIDMPKKSGLQMAKAIKELNPFQAIIIKTRHDDTKSLLEAFDIHIDGYILKSDPKEKLLKKLEEIAKRNSIRVNNIKKRQKLESILQYQSNLILLTDFKDIFYASQSFLDFFNISKKEELFLRYDKLFDIFIKHDEYLHGNNKEEFLAKFNETSTLRKVVLLLDKSFNPKAFHLNIDKVEKEENRYILSFANISILQERSLEISYKAYIDGLTGVNNRNCFEESFEKEFKNFKRTNNSFCVGVIDIDFFKSFNDTHGHLIGDEVLIMIANTINENIRENDFFARWGGEEFVLLMKQTDINIAKRVCEDIRKLVENTQHKKAGNITCSFGVTQVKNNDNIQKVFQRCDKALYRAKDEGRNRVYIS